jgi:hypothetical protein
VPAANGVQLLANLGEGTGGQGDGAVFLALAIVDGDEHGIEVKAVDAKVDALA